METHLSPRLTYKTVGKSICFTRKSAQDLYRKIFIPTEIVEKSLKYVHYPDMLTITDGKIIKILSARNWNVELCCFKGKSYLCYQKLDKDSNKLW